MDFLKVFLESFEMYAGPSLSEIILNLIFFVETFRRKIALT